MIRELDKKDLAQVNGGVMPLIGLAASVVGHFTARSVAGSIASRVGYGASVYGVATWLGD